MDSPVVSLRRKLAFALLLAAYFFLVSWDSLKAPFTADEMMAIYIYWHPSPWRLLTSQFLLWRGYFRPLGGLFYIPTFLAFGLNPLPYHAFLLALLLAGAYQLYRFARALGAGELAAAMVALIACYHGGLSNLYYESVFVFDVLCGIFCLAAFAYYARIRASGCLLTGGQTLAFLALYLCALNSKEMAVTMPVMLLAYECLYHKPPGLPWKTSWRDFALWLRGPGRVLIYAGLMNLVYIWGKAYGQYGLMKDPAYTPRYSWARLVDFEERYLGDIFYNLPRFGALATLVIWLVVTYFCWRSKRPILRFCWFWVALTPLPIMFLEGRDQACLYVTLGGWAVMGATLLTDWLPSAVRVVSGEPWFRRMEPARLRATLVAAIMIVWAWASWSYKATWISPVIHKIDPQIEAVIAQFRAVNPQVPPGAKVVFLDDPLHNFDMAFIAELWFRNRRTRVILNPITPVSPPELASADAVFTWRDGKLVRQR